METDVDSVRAVTTETIEMETEMAADLAREDHRVARADVPKAEEAEITVSAVRTAVARAEHVRDREKAVLPIPYLLRS